MTVQRTAARRTPRSLLSAWSLQAALLVIVILLGVGLELHRRHYLPFLSDDAMISFRYAERLTQGAGLTWTDGERVEGYSDLLWVLLIAGLRMLGVEPIDGARVLGFIGAYAALFAVGFGPRSALPSLPRLLAGGTLLVVSPPLAIWAIGGLEHGFMTGVLAVAMAGVAWGLEQPRLAAKTSWWIGVPFAALACLRVDGFVLLLANLPALGLARLGWREKLHRLLVWSAPTAAVWLAQLVFRYGYYHELVPNTALVKVVVGWKTLQSGLVYLRGGLWADLPLVVLAVIGGAYAVWRGSGQRVWLPCSVFLGWSAYVVGVGGDIFPGWRQLVFLLVPLAWLVAEGAEALVVRLGHRAWWAVAVVGPVAILQLKIGADDPGNQLAMTERWEWEGLSVGKMLRRAFGSRKPMLAVDAAGALPYWSRLPALDMLGLNDAYLPRHGSRDSTRELGHNLGDGQYVLRRGPDLIALNGASGDPDPLFIGGRQLLGMPEFRARYQLLYAMGTGVPPMLGILYVKRDGRVGIRRSPERVEIPAYLLANESHLPPAYLDGSDRLVVDLVPNQSRNLNRVWLAAGVWTLKTDPPHPAIAVRFGCAGRAAVRRNRASERSIRLLVPTELDLTLQLEGSTRVSELRTLTFYLRPEAEPSYQCSGDGGLARIRLDALASAGRENSDWQAPQNVVFGREGLSVDLGAPRHPVALELSVDNDDTYLVRGYAAGDRLVWQARIDPRDNGGGMAVHRLEVPARARTAGLTRLELHATAGDENFSLGHLRLEDAK